MPILHKADVKLEIDWDDDGYASPNADISRDVMLMRLSAGAIMGDPRTITTSTAYGSARLTS